MDEPFDEVPEFLTDSEREQFERTEAARFRQAILEGFDDAIHGRVVNYQGDLRKLLRERRRRLLGDH